MITTFENRCVLQIYVIVLRPIFHKTYKGKNRSKYTCELYITNQSYPNKVGIVFTMYQIMRSKGEFWAGPRLQLLPRPIFTSHIPFKKRPLGPLIKEPSSVSSILRFIYSAVKNKNFKNVSSSVTIFRKPAAFRNNRVRLTQYVHAIYVLWINTSTREKYIEPQYTK